MPVLNQILLAKYAIPSIVFCLAVLAGILIDSIKQFPLSYRRISLALLLLYFVFIVLPALGNPSKSLAHYFVDNTAMLSALGYIGGMTVAIYLLSYLYTHQEVSTRVMQVVFLILAISGPFRSSDIITRPDRVDPYQTPPFVDYLMKDSDLFRVFGLNGILYPNISTAYRISDVRWLNALVPQRAYGFSTKFINAVEPTTSRLTGTVLPISDAMFNLLNIKYVLSVNNSVTNANACLLNDNIQPYFGSNTIDNFNS